MRLARIILWTFLWSLAFMATLWAIGALYYDFPIAKLRSVAAIAFTVLVFLALLFGRGKTRKLFVVVCGFLIVLAWWRLALKPSNDRPWQADVAETGWAEIGPGPAADCAPQTQETLFIGWGAILVSLSRGPPT